MPFLHNSEKVFSQNSLPCVKEDISCKFLYTYKLADNLIENVLLIWALSQYKTRNFSPAT